MNRIISEKLKFVTNRGNVIFVPVLVTALKLPTKNSNREQSIITNQCMEIYENYFSIYYLRSHITFDMNSRCTINIIFIVILFVAYLADGILFVSIE